MRSIIMTAFAAACLFASCKKNDNSSESRPDTFVQLQKIELEDEIINLQYNDQHQLTKMETFDKEDNLTRRYISFTYENNLPAKAEFFAIAGNTHEKYSEYHIKHSDQKKIAYVAMGVKGVDGLYTWNDTVDYTFNSSNKLTAIKFRIEDAAETVYSYDSKGNFIRTDNQVTYGNYMIENKYKFQYDNHPNPFSVNGLGILIFTVNSFDNFTQPQLLSTNNPVYEENAYKRTERDVNNQPVGIYESTNNTEYTTTQDEHGGLKHVKLRYFGVTKQNGNQTGSHDNSFDQKYTCIKKQL